MTSLAVRRRREVPFDPRFFDADPLFWPIARAAATFAAESDWPEVESYARAFAGRPAVTFEAASPEPRRRRGPRDPAALYDARITRDRCVLTRPRSWHDYLNALVWATFPRAKLALHERQHRALSARIEPGASRLPATRSREQDALALIDEGGVVLLADAERQVPVVFGHAIYEGIVLGVRPTMARVLTAALPPGPVDEAACLTLADETLASRLAGPALVPEDLQWMPLPGR
jgi:Protein of unknown function (DUF3025)